MTDPPRLAGALLAGALLAGVTVSAAGFLLLAWRGPHAATALSAFLAAGGWLWVACWGAAAGALAVALRASRSGRLRAVLIAASLALAPLVLRPSLAPLRSAAPRTRMAKVQAIRRDSYGPPQAVAALLTYARDRDPDVREQTALALGRNTIVTDIEHPVATRPTRFADSPLRIQMATTLLELMRGDSAVAVRAEAARALWNAPHAYGRVPEAAETLAAVLDRAGRVDQPERLAWLALDAAAGASEPALHAAVTRFAARTSDTALATAARQALAR